MMKFRWALLPLVASLGLSAVGCGYSEEEMNEKKRQIDKLQKELEASKALHEEDQKNNAAAKGELERLGTRSKEEQEKLQKALAEYKLRADQLAAIEARFKDLRTRLERLSQLGIRFVVRNNRMVIELPGDLLFDSGKDELKKGGMDVLGQVAELIRNDKELRTRHFEISGHTDNAKYPHGGPFKDNWGLSLARARNVVLYMTAPAEGAKLSKTGGGLDPKLLSAAGYGEFQPIAGTVDAQSDAEKQKNRRVELVALPNVDEMLNLNSLTK
jgi:chemotaxis protein MotB